MSCNRNAIVAVGLLAVTWVVFGTAIRAAAEDAPVIMDMDTARLKPGDVEKDGQKLPIGTVEVVDGKIGKACKLSFTQEVAGFMSAWVNPTVKYEEYDGISFYVKGDGSKNWGGLHLIDGEDYGLRFSYCFPIDSTDWVKITIPWRDLVPDLTGTAIDAKTGYNPSKLRTVMFGKWFYWGTWPKVSYTIDHLALEKKIELDNTDYTPKGGPLARVQAKLKDKKPITLVTMGDSLTDRKHWANREVVWAEMLTKQLKEKYGSEVTWVNPALGGTTLSQNLIVMPRWVAQAPSPDLVTVWFGGNDFDTKVTPERFKEYLRLAVDRIRRQTKGSADILLMTTCPGHARWDAYKDLAQAARDVAKEKNCGVADVEADFRKAGSADEAMTQKYWAWDKVHLGAKGHEVARDCVLKALETTK